MGDSSGYKLSQRADRFFVSSKTCNGCGFKRKSLPLNVRQWVCPECGEIHDRDQNAARNILAAGLLAIRIAGRAEP
ncbi:zinc ribbon domain-containing protein [Caballeronia arationis]|uniref:zinc ribbon domain-containing protein n=1 Tax=Caballeronia arationis TaxID=1777142 RepID=UPI00190E62F0|nr:zinc ribbon domain-containing protein [Caballeronia arationis]